MEGILTFLDQVRRSALPSDYFDDAILADAGELARTIHVAAQSALSSTRSARSLPPYLSLTTVDASLTDMRMTGLAANRAIRAELLRLAAAAPPTSVSGIFGKTLWCFSPSEYTDSWPPISSMARLGKSTDRLTTPDVLSMHRLEVRGWLSSVAAALTRRGFAAAVNDSSELVSAACQSIRETDWMQADAAAGLRALKCFTQPTWWVRPRRLSTDRRLDRHFRLLQSERQYRHDVLERADGEWVLALTDVAGLFLGEVRSQEGLHRLAVGEGETSSFGVAGSMLNALQRHRSAYVPGDALFSARRQVARRLDDALSRIAETVGVLGGEAYATHGDGVSVLLPRECWDSWVSELGRSPPNLRTAVGGVLLHNSSEEAERAVEIALVTARAGLVLGGASFGAHLGKGDESLIDSARRKWMALAGSADVVERWIGSKALATLRLLCQE